MEENVFANLISLKEASIKWNIDDSVLRRAITSGKLKRGVDVEKFGKQWVVTTQSMNREYGQIDKVETKTNSDIKNRQIYYYQSEILFLYSKKHKKDFKTSSELFKKHNVFQMILDCYDYLHLGNTNDVVKDVHSRIVRGIVYGK